MNRTWDSGGDCDDDDRSADSAKSLRLDKYNAYNAYNTKKLAAYNIEQKVAEYDALNASRDSACEGDSWSGSDFGCDGVCFSGLVNDECGHCRFCL